MYDSNTKTWKETVEPGTVIGLTISPCLTLWYVRPMGRSTSRRWSGQDVGRVDDTNPMPSFVDSTINDGVLRP
ncbi:hypothetical protein [Enterobacter phage 01_vB_Eclo_IJM]|nr:hypothetical protein [Enterobacter phage 01_vB_Eclo_IJM]